MPGQLSHSPADILRRALTDLTLGSDPPAGPWPVYTSLEPGSPDNTVTVFDSVGLGHGREHTRGERQEHHGVQVRVRSNTHTAGYSKARAIAVALDQDLLHTEVEFDGALYRIWSVSRTSDVLAIGKESPASARRLFVVNALISVRQFGVPSPDVQAVVFGGVYVTMGGVYLTWSDN